MNAKEQMFAAWREWDIELSDFARKQKARADLNAAIDAYKAESKSDSPRWAIMFYLRDEYAEWRIDNP